MTEPSASASSRAAVGLDDVDDMLLLGGGGQPARNASCSQSAQIDGSTLASTSRGPSPPRTQSPIGARSSTFRAVIAGDAVRGCDGGQVGIREADEIGLAAHRREVMHLGAVGGVVVDDDEQPDSGARGRVQLLQRKEQPAVADGRDGDPLRARDGRADRAPEAEADRLEAVREDPVARVLDVEEHGRPAGEVPRVDRPRSSPAAAGRRARSTASSGRCNLLGPRRLEGLVAPAAGGDLRPTSSVRNPVALTPRAASSASSARATAPASPTIAEVGAAVRADRAGLHIDLHQTRAGRDELAVARGPVIQRRAEREHDVGLRQELRGDGRREPARDPQRVRVAVEDALGHGAVGEQRARIATPARRARGRRRPGPRPGRR